MKDGLRDPENECRTFSDGYLVVREADTVQVAYKSSRAASGPRRSCGASSHFTQSPFTTEGHLHLSTAVALAQ